jgi:hypothetical protein
VGKTVVSAFGGEGDDSIIGGPERSLFVPDYEYPTPPPVVAVEPIAYWSFNEEDGHDIADAAGDPQDGTFFGWHPDLDDDGAEAAFDAQTGADFHGSSHEYIAVDHDPAFEVEEGTIQLWFNADRTRGHQALFSKDHIGYETGGHLNIGLDGDRIEVRLQSTDESYYIKTDRLVDNGRWHHLAFTFGDEGMKLFIDGEPAGENDFSGGLAGNAEPIVIGGSLMWNDTDGSDLSELKVRDSFDGRIDEVAVFGEALDADQVRQLIAGGPTSVTDGGAGLGLSVGSGQPEWVLAFLTDQMNGDSGHHDEKKIKIFLSGEEED